MPTIAALNSNAVSATYKEKYRKVVAELFEAEQNVCSMIETRADVEVIGPRGIRAAKKMRQGGQMRTWDPDGGPMGRGTGPEFAYTTLTPIPLLIALEKTKAAMWNTASEDIAMRNAVRDQLKDGTREYKANLDRYLMGDGTGVMATLDGTNVINTTTAYLGGTLGARHLRDGQQYVLYPSNLAGPRVDGGGNIVTYTVVQTDYPNKTALLNKAVNTAVGVTNTDVFLPAGVTGANPQWINGFRYHFTSSSSGLWMGMSRASWPQIRSIEIAAGGALVWQHIRTLKNKMQVFRENCFTKGRWQFVWHPAQAEAYEGLAQQQVHYVKRPSERTGVEVMFDQSDLKIDQFDAMTSANQKPDVIDLCNWDNWWRGETVPFGLYTVDDVSTFPVYDITTGTGGGLVAADISYMAQIAQWAVDDPGLGGVISGLSYNSQDY